MPPAKSIPEVEPAPDEHPDREHRQHDRDDEEGAALPEERDRRLVGDESETPHSADPSAPKHKAGITSNEAIAPHPLCVMAGLVPAIHRRRIASASPPPGGSRDRVDARNESGHDGG